MLHPNILCASPPGLGIPICFGATIFYPSGVLLGWVMMNSANSGEMSPLSRLASGFGLHDGFYDGVMSMTEDRYFL